MDDPRLVWTDESQGVSTSSNEYLTSGRGGGLRCHSVRGDVGRSESSSNGGDPRGG